MAWLREALGPRSLGLRWRPQGVAPFGQARSQSAPSKATLQELSSVPRERNRNFSATACGLGSVDPS